MRIVVLGYIVRAPLGGLVWHHLQYVLGLKQMGHDVLFLEDSDDFAGCYNPQTNEVTMDPAYGLRFIADVFNKFDMADQWCYFDAHQTKWYGLTKQKALAFCHSADMVINISGVNPLREWCFTIPKRIFIDTDPAFTQIKHLTNDKAMSLAKAHTHYYSFAENIGKPFCTIPEDGFPWKPTRQPVFLPAWKNTDADKTAKWTTVMQWDSYKNQTYNGNQYGMKSLSFAAFNKVPEHLPNEQFELATGSPTVPKEELENYGWHIISSLIPTQTPATYQQYIALSKAEWSVAKHGYVAGKSGWFSERSTCYLASGRPVLVQDTGFSGSIETGKGIFVFNNIADIVENVRRINTDYGEHCKNARKIVQEFFSAEKVLLPLVNS